MLKLLVRDRSVYQAYGPRLTDEHFRSATRRKALRGAARRPTATTAPIAGGEDEKLAAAIAALAVEPLEADGDAGYAEPCGADSRSSC